MYAQYMTRDEELFRLRAEARILRQNAARITRTVITTNATVEKLSTELEEKRRTIKELVSQNRKLLEELDKMRKQRDTYKEMTFKQKRVLSSALDPLPTGRKRGGQVGHVGHGRTTPVAVTHHQRVFTATCPDCHHDLTRSKQVVTHTVTDIPDWHEITPLVTEYSIERQWCPSCHKEVRATPTGVIPHCKLGINLLAAALIWRYHTRQTIIHIRGHLALQYGITVSEGALIGMLHKARILLGTRYDQLLATVRGSPVRHGDETGYRVGGVNGWAWAGVTEDTNYYTIEDSRGKGIADKLFGGTDGVLVRDDYAAYEHLSLPHQSCWAHLLRKSHEAAGDIHASDEVQKLHEQLTNLFALLCEDIAQPFDRKERQELYGWYTKDLERIIAAGYVNTDTQAIQTRIARQHTNLITALLYPDVPLTNNAAERAIRPLVIMRKMSGGCQTTEGAKTHAVNFSIVSTIHKRKLPLLDTVRDYLLTGATDKN